MNTSFAEFVKLREDEQVGSKDYDIRVGLSNVLANAYKEPYRWLGNGLKHARASAEMQNDAAAMELMDRLEHHTMVFFQKIRNLMQPGRGGWQMAPEHGQAAQEYQAEWKWFAQQYGREVKLYSDRKEQEFVQRNPQFAR